MKKLLNIVGKIDLEKILLEIQSLNADSQICLTGTHKDQDPYELISHDKDFNFVFNRNKIKNVTYDNCNVPLFDIPYTNYVIKKFNMVFPRLMVMHPRQCYGYHTDKTVRLHIPLITNKDNFFVIEDTVVRLPADGNVYEVDTTKMHTFVNASSITRVHIVGLLNNET
jgi:hypothetical protein